MSSSHLKAEIGIAGVVLAGGQSTRMGASKADLPFGPERMIQRVVRLLSSAVRPIVVVAASGQSLPEFHSGVLVTRDAIAGRGPLQGLHAGLTAISSYADAAYVTSCDCPLLVPAFVRVLMSQLQDFDAVAPVQGEQMHPLAAVYRARLLPLVQECLATDRRSLHGLLERAHSRRVPVTELQVADPALATLRNVNDPDEYLAALKAAGITPDSAGLAALEKLRTA